MKLKKIGVFLLGTAIGGVIISFSTMKTITQAKKNEKKYLTLFRMMNQYLVTKQLKQTFPQNRSSGNSTQLIL